MSMKKHINIGKGKDRVLLNLLSDPAVLFDEKGQFLVVNDVFEEVTGLSQKKLVGKPFFELDIISAESKAILLENLKKRIQGASVEPYEVYYIDKAGAKRCVEVKGKKVSYAGQPADLVVFHDLTRRKENQRRLKEYAERMEALVEEKVKEVKESEEKFRAMSTCAKDAIVAVSSTGEVVYWNPAAEQIFGYSREEAVGKNVLNLLVPPRDQGFQQPFFELVESSQLLQGKILEFNALRKDGKEFPAELSSALMPFKGAMCLLGIVRDVSERKKSEAKLLASEKKYRVLFKELKKAEKQLLEERDRAQNYLDIADVMLVALDPKGRVTLLNRKACAILKCTAEEALGKNWFDTFLPKDTKNNVKKTFQASIKEKKCMIDYNENYVVPKSGEAHLIAWHNVILRNSRGQVIGALSSGEDITEWKRAQQALTDSEEKFRAISTYASDAIILLDKTDKIVYWNHAAEIIFGYAKEEAIGKKLNSLIVPPKNHRHHLEKLKRLLETKTRFSEKITEITALKKDGTEFPIELSATVLSLKGVQYVLEIIRDVSERKKMEDALKQERDTLEAVTANIGAGLAIISKDYRILWANKVLKQNFVDIENKICYSTFNILDTICPDCGVKKVFENGVSFDSHEYRNPFEETGKDRWIELIVTPLKDKDGTVIAALELAVEITEKKNAAILEETMAALSKQLLSSEPMDKIAETVLDYTQQFTKSQFGYVGYIDPKTGYLVVPTHTKPVWEKCEMKEKTTVFKEFRGLWGWPLKTGKAFFNNNPSKNPQSTGTPQGHIPIRRFLSVPAFCNGKMVGQISLANSARDYTEADVAMVKRFASFYALAIQRRFAEEQLADYATNLEEKVRARTIELEKLQERLLKSERLAAIGELAGMVGHDLRNPLTGIKNAAYYLKTKENVCAEANNSAMLEIIDSAIEHANRIINDLLDYSREIRLELEEGTPCLLLAEALMLVEIPKEIKLLDRTHDEPKMMIDVDKMIRIFINLIKNAIDAMPNGGTLEVGSRQKADKVEFTFTDTGTGMSEEVKAKLFSPLFTTKAQGMGFGLPICKRIVEAHGGTITVQSALGKGTTFTVTFLWNRN